MSLTRVRVRVRGTVQGVGFRPFVYALAAELGLAGFVGNDPAGVFAEAEGPAAAVAAFLAGLRDRAPALAVVEDVTSVPLPPVGRSGFAIVPSAPDGPRLRPVSADARDLRRLPGRAVRTRPTGGTATRSSTAPTAGRGSPSSPACPYDRPLTTMAGFAMCADCAAEYADPADRRFHAQPVCCPACGPALALARRSRPAAGRATRSRPRPRPAAPAARCWRSRAWAATTSPWTPAAEPAVAALRARKHREDKPFAVMAADLAAAGRAGEVDPAAVELLTGRRRRPIVLLPRRPDAPLAAVGRAGQPRASACMLPYTPLHHLLAAAVGRPIVLTSGNVSDEPIAYADDDAPARLAGIADAFLAHDRPIHTRTDDSVVRVAARPADAAAPVPRLRARAAAAAAGRRRRPVLACGAELKNTFCLAAGPARVRLPPHRRPGELGDLRAPSPTGSSTSGGCSTSSRSWSRTTCTRTTCPPSTRWSWRGVELVGVQHHHAHIASCLADNGEAGPVIGVAFDGTGLRPGRHDLGRRVPGRRPDRLPAGRPPGAGAAARRRGGDQAAVADGGGVPGRRLRRRRAAGWRSPGATPAAGTRWCDGRRGVNAPRTSSAGRLFDAVAALLGVRDAISYEGQAAIELEQRADPAERGATG